MPEAYRCRVNLLKLTIISYSLTFLCGVMVILPFVVKVQAADYFHTSLERMGYVFSFFMIGMVAAQYLNGFLVKKISLKGEIFFITIIYALSVALMATAHHIDALIAPLIAIGFCAGVCTTMPNFIIVHAFHGSDRSSKLNRIDFFFSVGSFVYPMIAAVMIAHFFSWVAIYISALVIFVWLIAWSLMTKFPDLNEASDHKNGHFSKWNINVYIVAIAILCFFLSYVGFTYWLEPYLQVKLGMSVKAANFGLTLFWILYAVGCFIASFAVKYIKLNRFIIFSLVLALIGYIGIASTHNTHTMLVLIAVLGLGCSTIFSSGISFGTHQVASPSPRIVALYITCSGIGTLTGQAYSSFIETHGGFNALIICSMILLIISLLLFIVVSMHNRLKGSYHDKSCGQSLH